jgi:hypothetical protein
MGTELRSTGYPTVETDAPRIDKMILDSRAPMMIQGVLNSPPTIQPNLGSLVT